MGGSGGRGSGKGRREAPILALVNSIHSSMFHAITKLSFIQLDQKPFINSHQQIPGGPNEATITWRTSTRNKTRL